MKLISGCILLAFISLSSCGQAHSNSDNSMATTQTHTKLDKSKVPKEVTDAFYNQYPLATYGDWYGYPTFTNGTSKAIYGKNGNKIASHKTLNSDMPAAVTDAINNGDYKSWTVEKDKEEIFKDADSDKMKVYKVTVAKGSEKHALYFQQDGKMLKDIKAA